MDLGIPLSEKVLELLAKGGISEPFEIQTQAANPVFSGESTKIHAPTGSGKTLSYILPLCTQLCEDEELQLIILSSSPELASQIHSVAKHYFPEISSILLLGSANIQRQKDRLKKKPRLLVGTPGRVFELFCLERFFIEEETIVVLDEVDTLLEGSSFDKVLSLVEGCGQLITASATYGDAAKKFLEECPFEMTEVFTDKREGTVNHCYVFCNPNKKDISLIKLLKEKKLSKVLLFINDLKYSNHLMRKLDDQGIKNLRLDSRIKKAERERAVKELKDGKIKVLITSDSLSRGIDIKDATVIQFNIARDKEVYVHRSGRAGRAGATGSCFSLVTAKNAYLLKKLSKALNIEFEEIKFSTPRKRVKSTAKQKTKSTSKTRKSKSKKKKS